MKLKISKKELILNITMPLVVFFLGFLLATCLPEKESTLIRKNRSGGENQRAIMELPPVKSFLKYLDCIKNKDTLQIWNNSSYYRKLAFRDANNMMYDYCLTYGYELQYIIPIGENHSSTGRSPKLDTVFSFYALMRFEDDVCLVGEVDRLKAFHNIELEDLNDLEHFEPLFDSVLKEVYEFVDCRFVIDSAEYVENVLREYMMDMTMKNYITQDWRFPVLFAERYKLQPKQKCNHCDVSSAKQGHSLLSRVLMEKEEGIWKVSGWSTIAMSRW